VSRKGGRVLPAGSREAQESLQAAKSPATRRLRIGIFIALLPPEGIGGAEFQAERLARELAARGHEVHVFTRGGKRRARKEERGGTRAGAEAAGPQVHRRPVVPVPGLRLLFEVLAAGWQGGRAPLDVLLCFMTVNSGLLGYVAHRLNGAPFVIWQRVESETRLHPKNWETRLSAWLHRRATENWVQTQRMASSFARAYERAGKQDAWRCIASHLRVLGNGVDQPPPLAREEPPPRRFLFVGRLVQDKNPFALIEAARSLQGAEVWMAGGGPLAAALQRAAAGTPVRLLGVQPRERILSLLQECRALVLCSHNEGLPNVVLEALAAGRPVIATPVGAVPEVVEDGVNGRLVPEGDVGALRRGMEELLDDATWSRMASQTRPSVARFGWPQLVDRVEAALLEVAARRR